MGDSHFYLGSRSEKLHEKTYEEESLVPLGSNCTLRSCSPASVSFISSRLSSSSLTSWTRGVTPSGDRHNGGSRPAVEANGTLLEVRWLWLSPSFYSSTRGISPSDQRNSLVPSSSFPALPVATAQLSSGPSAASGGVEGCSMGGGSDTRSVSLLSEEKRVPETEGDNGEEPVASRLYSQQDCSLSGNREKGTGFLPHLVAEHRPDAQKDQEDGDRQGKNSWWRASVNSSGFPLSSNKILTQEETTEGGFPKLRSLRDLLQGGLADNRKLQPFSRLYGFVRVKDADHRLSGWYPLDRIFVRIPDASFSSSSLLHAFSSPSPIPSSPSGPSTAELSSSFTPELSVSNSCHSPVEGGGGGGKNNSSDRRRRLSSQSPTSSSTTRASDTSTNSFRSISASQVIRRPLLSCIYNEVTPGMSRTLRAEKILDYFDERLLRDGKTPTSIRYFIYVQQFIFSPWYYAPYGLLYPEYDPMRYIPTPSSAFGPSWDLSDRTNTLPQKEEKDEREARISKLYARAMKRGREETSIRNRTDSLSSSGGDQVSAFSFSSSPLLRYHDDVDVGNRLLPLITRSTTCNPYIRDAFLCPFSLRIYSTLEQMQYEIQQYRSGAGDVSFSSKPRSSSTSFLRPPGIKIYEDIHRGIAVFEVNGSQHITYCRHLFLIGKSFLEKKLAGHDVHNYYFFVVCLHRKYFPRFEFRQEKNQHAAGYPENTQKMEGKAEGQTTGAKQKAEKKDDDEDIWFFAGYFSWEKEVETCNLACIVTLPCFGMQQAHHCSGSTCDSMSAKDIRDSTESPPPRIPKGIGQFMIRLSYELAYRRGHYNGTPERPLSDLGELAYLHYWGTVLLEWWYHHYPLSDKEMMSDEALRGCVDDSHRVDRGGEKEGKLGGKMNWRGTGQRSRITTTMLQNTHRVQSDTRREYKGQRGRMTRVSPKRVQEEPTEEEGRAFAVQNGASFREASNISGIQRRVLEGTRKVNSSSTASREEEVVIVEDDDEVEDDKDGRHRCSQNNTNTDYDEDNGGDGENNDDELQREEDEDEAEEGSADGGKDFSVADNDGDMTRNGKEEQVVTGVRPLNIRERISSSRRDQYSLTDIAKEVGLEVNDTRRAVLHKGLLQWSADDRAPKWVLPKEFIRREHEKFVQRRVSYPDCNSDDFYAAFLPRLLLPKALSYHTPPNYWDDKDPQTYF